MASAIYPGIVVGVFFLSCVAMLRNTSSVSFFAVLVVYCLLLLVVWGVASRGSGLCAAVTVLVRKHGCVFSYDLATVSLTLHAIMTLFFLRFVLMTSPQNSHVGGNQVHFIFQHQNPVTKEWEEKHFKKTPKVRPTQGAHTPVSL